VDIKINGSIDEARAKMLSCHREMLDIIRRSQALIAETKQLLASSEIHAASEQASPLRVNSASE
jgi:hypothetical protein